MKGGSACSRDDGAVGQVEKTYLWSDTREEAEVS